MANSTKQPTKRLYECDECHARRFVPWVELNRAARPTCAACGSARLELVSEDAKNDRARLNRERLTGSGGSLELTGSAKNYHRNVR